MGVPRGFGDDIQEFCGADVVGAGAAHENAAGTQHFKGAEVEFFVSAERSVEGATAFGERGRVEDDGVVLLAGSGIVAQQVECVGLNPFDFAAV